MISRRFSVFSARNVHVCHAKLIQRSRNLFSSFKFKLADITADASGSRRVLCTAAVFIGNFALVKVWEKKKFYREAEIIFFFL